jgi:hypothetical protein
VYVYTSWLSVDERSRCAELLWGTRCGSLKGVAARSCCGSLLWESPGEESREQNENRGKRNGVAGESLWRGVAMNHCGELLQGIAGTESQGSRGET